MKILTLTTSLFLLMSCNFSKGVQEKYPENKSELFKTENADYTLKIYSVDNKYDENNRKQCDNFYHSTRNDSTFYFYGASPLRFLSSILDTKKEFINNFPDDAINCNFMVCNFNGREKLPENQTQILLNAYKEIFSLEIKEEEKILDAYTLKIVDQKLLNKFISTSKKDRSLINYKKSKIKTENVSLSFLNDYLDSQTHEILTKTNLTEEEYDLKFKFSADLKELNVNLSKFGLQYVPEKTTQKIYTVIR